MLFSSGFGYIHFMKCILGSGFPLFFVSIFTLLKFCIYIPCFFLTSISELCTFLYILQTYVLYTKQGCVHKLSLYIFSLIYICYTIVNILLYSQPFLLAEESIYIYQYVFICEVYQTTLYVMQCEHLPPNYCTELVK